MSFSEKPIVQRGRKDAVKSSACGSHRLL